MRHVGARYQVTRNLNTRLGERKDRSTSSTAADKAIDRHADAKKLYQGLLLAITQSYPDAPGTYTIIVDKSDQGPGIMLPRNLANSFISTLLPLSRHKFRTCNIENDWDFVAYLRCTLCVVKKHTRLLEILARQQPSTTKTISDVIAFVDVRRQLSTAQHNAHSGKHQASLHQGSYMDQIDGVAHLLTASAQQQSAIQKHKEYLAHFEKQRIQTEHDLEQCHDHLGRLGGKFCDRQQHLSKIPCYNGCQHS